MASGMAVSSSSLTFGDVLVRDGMITQAQLRRAVETQKNSDLSLGRLLVEMSFITEAMRIEVLQKSFGYDLINLDDVKADPVVGKLIPAGFAEKHLILPIRLAKGNTLVVAMEDPSDLVVIDAVKNQVGMTVKAYIAPSEDLAKRIRALSEGSEEQPAEEKIALPRERGRLYRFARYTSFPVLLFAPFVGFILLLVLNGSFQSWLSSRSGEFDIFLYTVLLWGLWGVVLYEVNGLVFKTDEKKKAEEEV